MDILKMRYIQKGYIRHETRCPTPACRSRRGHPRAVAAASDHRGAARGPVDLSGLGSPDLMAFGASDPRSALPLSPSAFHILLALAEGERHGYSISKEVEAATGGLVKLPPGTLYRLIKQMSSDGWIHEAGAPDAGEDQRRRSYRLTERGRRIAEAEAQRLEDLVRIARERKLLPAVAFG